MSSRRCLVAAGAVASLLVAALLLRSVAGDLGGPRGGGPDAAPDASPEGPPAARDPRVRAGQGDGAAPGTGEVPSPPARPATALVVRVTRAADGAPVPGATVEILGDSTAVPAGPGDAAGADGRVRLEFTAAGTAECVVRAPDFVRAECSAEIAAGEERTVDVALDRGVAVEGRVVRSEDGAPVFRALVVATEGGSRGRASSVSSAGPLGAVQTGSDGSFRLGGLPANGTVTLTASARWRAPASQAVVPAADSADAQSAELRLDAAGAVRGSVRDRRGAPVGGAQVFVVPADEPMLLENPTWVTMSSEDGRREALRAVTGPDGAYEVDGVPFAAAHHVLATAGGFARSEPTRDVRVDAAHAEAVVDLVVRDCGAIEAVVLTSSGSPLADAEVEVRRGPRPVAAVRTDASGRAVASGLDVAGYAVTVRARGLPKVVRAHAVAEGATTRIEFRLPQGVAIEGVVVDDAGRAMPGARVAASRPTWEKAFEGLPESEGEAVADGEGRFRIEGLLEGPHELCAQESGRPVTGELSPVAAPAAGVRVVSLRRATLRFRLLVPAGAEPPGELHVHIGSGVHRPRWAASPVDVPGLDPGTHAVEFRVAGFVGFDRSVEFAPGGVADLGEIALDPGHELTGRVLDASGAPVAGAAVRCGDVFTPTHQDVTTDAAGAFRLRHLAAGETDVEVEAEGFLEWSGPLRAGPGEATAQVVLTRGALLDGTVRGPDGATLADVFVHVFDPASKSAGDDTEHREAWERTDARGRFTARLLAGRYRIDVVWKAVGREDVVAAVETELADGRTTPVVVDLKR